MNKLVVIAAVAAIVYLIAKNARAGGVSAEYEYASDPDNWEYYEDGYQPFSGAVY